MEKLQYINDVSGETTVYKTMYSGGELALSKLCTLKQKEKLKQAELCLAVIQ